MNYTSIEQSKKLLELGLSPETADIWWDETERFPRFIKHYHDYLSQQIPPVPCWTTGALLNLIPSYTIIQNPLTDNIVIWSQGLNTGEWETLLDACYNMVCQLLVSNLIKKRKQQKITLKT